jgi:hypothetical protein
MPGSSLEAGWCAWGRRHGTTINGLSVWRWNCIVVIASDRIVDVALIAIILEVFRTVVLVNGFPARLRLVEVLLVERPNTVGTLLRIVCRILWRQRAKSQGEPTSVTTNIKALILRLQRLLGDSRSCCMIWGRVTLLGIFGPVDVHCRDLGIRLSIVTVVARCIAHRK